jgi:hypothetical protein
MEKKALRLKDIKVGMTYCHPDYVYPHNELMTVTGIKYNENAGRPIKDMWGGEVWAEPFAEVDAIGTITGEKGGFSVQSEDSDLDWMLWVNSPEERMQAIYADRRKEVIDTAKENLGKIVEAMRELRNYPAYLDKDEKMKHLTDLVAKAMLEVF